ncbi:unnamed protein product [Durusdinium trenchii]|uniref:S-adenosyl-L-methionine-dependent methyltransferase MSMEG_1480/MSMEI_1444 n=2 Tax=Durusdinium trenchii TaxID=1381693 RepID=A0ABP0QL76_9DINO
MSDLQAFKAEGSEDLTKNFTNDSAMMIAYERCLETSKPAEERLVMDPFAHVLAGPKGKMLSDQFEVGCGQFGLDGWPEFHKTWTAVRTHFIDEQIARCGQIAQMVNLGAGLDTRAYRSETFRGFSKCFEVDMEIVNEEKRRIFDQVLGNPLPMCPVSIIDLDFLADHKNLRHELSAAGFQTEEPCLFVAEGLIMYLGPAGKLKLIRDISACAAPGSVWVLQFMDPSDSPWANSEQAKFALTREEAEEALTQGGWKDLQFWKFGDEGLNFGRFPLDQFRPCAAFSFVVAVKS